MVSTRSSGSAKATAAPAAGDKRKREKKQAESEKSDDAPKSDAQGERPAEEQQEDDAAEVDGGDKNTNSEHHEQDTQEPPAKSAKTSSPLEWLLSDEAFDMANPEIPKGHGEVDWDSSEGRQKTPPPASSPSRSGTKSGETILRYPHSHLTPFQNLIAACLLSKPFSHRLGLRTIQTLLNTPFGLRTLSDLDEAGYEGRRKVMWEARTQHKEKTAAQLGDVCEGVRELCGGNTKDQSEEELSELRGVRAQLDGLGAGEAADKVVQLLTKIKGIGPGGAGIFLRRVQGDWEEVFPYADERSLGAAREFGLVGEKDGAEVLAEKVGRDRAKFVRLLDTLIGLDLEKVLDKAKDAAGV